jgi:hypothetical protein
MANQIDPSLSEKYKVIDKGEQWHLFCKICKTGFSLRKPGDHPGNLLELLNHYAGCEKNENLPPDRR